MTIKNEIAQQYELDDLPLWKDPASHQILLQVLKEYEVNEEVFARCLSAYRGHAHKQRPRGITAEFDEIFQTIGLGE